MDNNNNDKYFYGTRFNLIFNTFVDTQSAFFMAILLDIMPLILILNHTIKPILPIILLLPINILMLYIICINLINFWNLFIIRRPLAIVSEDSVSIYEGVRNGYISIKYKDIKGIELFLCLNNSLFIIDVDNFDFYYNQTSNILVKFGIRLKQTHLFRNTYKRLYFISIYKYISLKNFDKFEDLVIEGANKYRNGIIDVRQTSPYSQK
jgi:hypothetical protein